MCNTSWWHLKEKTKMAIKLNKEESIKSLYTFNIIEVNIEDFNRIVKLDRITTEEENLKTPLRKSQNKNNGPTLTITSPKLNILADEVQERIGGLHNGVFFLGNLEDFGILECEDIDLIGELREASENYTKDVYITFQNDVGDGEYCYYDTSFEEAEKRFDKYIYEYNEVISSEHQDLLNLDEEDEGMFDKDALYKIVINEEYFETVFGEEEDIPSSFTIKIKMQGGEQNEI